MSITDVQVNELLSKVEWHEERKLLRSLILECGLEEEVKWGKLCYTYEGHNVVIIYGLKTYCALGFFKGSLLNDDKGILVQPGKHSQAMRQIRFSDLTEITDNKDTVIAYIGKAIQAEKDGLEVNFEEKDNLSFPDELQDVLDHDPEYAAAFNDLTPGRQRGYVLHFSDATQSRTRIARIKKHRAKILEGKGRNEQ